MQDSLTPYLTAGRGTLTHLHVANPFVATAKPDRLQIDWPDEFDALARRREIDAAVAEIDNLLIL
jgi:hypothetical protein